MTPDDRAAWKILAALVRDLGNDPNNRKVWALRVAMRALEKQVAVLPMIVRSEQPDREAGNNAPGSGVEIDPVSEKEKKS